MIANVTFGTQLESLPRDRVLLLVGCKRITTEDLLANAVSLRNVWTYASGARVALSGFPPQELIESLIALDGVAAAILLLPDSLSERQQTQLIEDAGCTVVIDPRQQQHRILAEPHKAKATATPTEWIFATSGTTTDPKLISHTLAGLTRTVMRDTKRGELYTWGLVYDPVRFAGLQVVLQSLLAGSRLALPSISSFEEQVAGLLRHEINALSATPSLWRKLLMDGRVKQLSLRQITLGGEAADQVILDSLKAAFPGARIVHIYASTEAGTGFAVRDGLAGFPRVWLTANDAAIGIRVDNDGHLWLRPEILARGKAISDRLSEDGYLDTEDLVSIDGDRVHFLGRSSGAINVGGNKVHPEEVERNIRLVPGILDARVFAKSSSMMGQLVAAEVVAAPGQDTKALKLRIQQHCRETLAPWQAPVLIAFVSALAETAAGKRSRRH